MTISVGDTLPNATLLKLGANGPEAVELSDVLKDSKVVIFGLPGAYTGTCSTAHVPSFMRCKDQFAAKGVDSILCVSVNDPFVMGAWSDATGAGDAGVEMLGDASGDFTKAIGLDFSVPAAGLLNRSKRYALVADNGVVSVLQIEENAGECTVSGGESLLDAL